MKYNKDDVLNQSIDEVVKSKATEANKSPQEFVNELKDGVKAGESRALSTLNDLVNLIVITHQEKTILKTGMGEIANMFLTEADADTRGNGKRYIKHFLQKPTDFEKNKFLPENNANEFSKLPQKVFFIKFKEDTGQIAQGSILKKWQIVYQEAELITYFINGQLREFIETQIKEQIGDSIIVYLYDFFMKKIIDETNGGGYIQNGTAANLFDCLTTEVFPTLKDMYLNTSKFNQDQTFTEAIDATKKEDILLLANPKVITMLESNIKSQLYNNQKVDIKNYVGKIHQVNFEFDFTGDTVVTKNSYYVDENTLIFIDTRSYFKAIKMLEKGGEQYFISNMSKMKIFHLWLASGYIPWGKRYIYKNANLMVSPTV